jgi:integrase
MTTTLLSRINNRMHGEFATLRDSWMLAMDADGYSARTQVSYQQAHRSLEKWIVGNAPGVGPEEITREHVRGWLVDLRATSSANTARSWFAGVRHFCKWMVAEGETDTDATQGIKTPRAGEPLTPVLSSKDIRAMLTACSGTDFACRRDAAIIMVFADGGLRLAEVTGLQVADIDLRDRILFVIGKGSNRSGPRRRSVQLGVKAARARRRSGPETPRIAGRRPGAPAPVPAHLGIGVPAGRGRGRRPDGAGRLAVAGDAGPLRPHCRRRPGPSLVPPAFAGRPALTRSVHLGPGVPRRGLAVLCARFGFELGAEPEHDLDGLQLLAGRHRRGRVDQLDLAAVRPHGVVRRDAGTAR